MKIYIKKNPNKSSKYKWVTIAEASNKTFLYIASGTYQEAKCNFQAYELDKIYNLYNMENSANKHELMLKREYLKLTNEEFKFSA